MLNSNYECMYFQDIIENYAVSNEKCVVYLRSYGWNNSDNVERINQSMDIYSNILPLDIFTALQQSEFVFISIDSIQEAIDFFDDVLPESQASCDKEDYIHYTIYNSLGQVIVNN